MFLAYVLALVLLVSSNLTLWLVLVFPAWVFVISVFILIISLRGGRAEAEGVIECLLCAFTSISEDKNRV